MGVTVRQCNVVLGLLFFFWGGGVRKTLQPVPYPKKKVAEDPHDKDEPHHSDPKP